ncbi:hypothetical protein C8R45DRAFT_933570 [Mycena sanguinolenta]|nr:hypothetical protein C8R45DRAFT_933570 [Mycena sanguinolenta]
MYKAGKVSRRTAAIHGWAAVVGLGLAVTVPGCQASEDIQGNFFTSSPSQRIFVGSVRTDRRLSSCGGLVELMDQFHTLGDPPGISGDFWDHGQLWNDVGAVLTQTERDSKADHKAFPPTTTTMHRPLPAKAPTADSTACPPTSASFEESKALRRRESNRQASRRYRAKHREKVLEAGCLRAAERRARSHGDPDFRARARAASARYQERNREELALEQRQARKKLYIRKHGVAAYSRWRHGNPISPSCALKSPACNADEDNNGDAGDADDEGETLSRPFWDWDNDPFLRRKPVPAVYR